MEIPVSLSSQEPHRKAIDHLQSFAAVTLAALRGRRAYRSANGGNSEHGGPSTMRPNPYVRRLGRAFFFWFFITSVTLAAAAGGPGKKPGETAGPVISADFMQPQILNAGPDPTLRYPVLRVTGMSPRSYSYGWLDVSRTRLRYTVVQPEKKVTEGFEIASKQVHDLALMQEPCILQCDRVGGQGKGRDEFIYLSQNRWGTVHSNFDVGRAARVTERGTSSLYKAIVNFDDLFASIITAPFREGDLEKVQTMLNDNPDLTLYRDGKGRTPLHFAAAGGHKDVVELLLAKGADVNAKDNRGATPLHGAAAGSHWDVDVTVSPPGNKPPLPTVVEAKNKDVISLLLAKGADVNAKDNGGATPMDFAAAGGHWDAVELLRQRGGKMWEPAGPAEAINAAAVLLGTECVRILAQQTHGSPFVVSVRHPVRVHLMAPVLPIADKPLPGAHTHLESKGDWGVIGTGDLAGLTFGGDSDSGGAWYLASGELQFRGSVAVGPSLVVFLSGEIEAPAPTGGNCIAGSVAQVDGVDYEFTGQVWNLKK